MKASSASGGGNAKALDVATCSTAKSTRLDFESETFVVYGVDNEKNCSLNYIGTLTGCHKGGTGERSLVAYPIDDGREIAKAQHGDESLPLYRCGACGELFMDRYASGAGLDCMTPAECPRCGEEKDVALAPKAVCVSGDICHTLRGEGSDGSEDGSGRGTPIIAFPERMSATQCASSENLSPALMAKNPTAIATRWIVRRLTPRECERLQGFPDDYTLVPHRGKPAKDGPRYKAIGNSWATVCAKWLGERIQVVDEILRKRELR